MSRSQIQSETETDRELGKREQTAVGPRPRTDHDFVLSGEVGRFAQQLTLGHRHGAGSLSYQHSVVQPHPARRWGNQVSALWAYEDGQQGATLGDKNSDTQ